MVRWTPSTLWMASVIELPNVSKSVASICIITSNGPVTVSTETIVVPAYDREVNSRPTLLALATSVSINTYPLTLLSPLVSFF